MTTVSKLAALEAANRAQEAVEAATAPGGELRAALDELLDRAVCIALDAAGIPEGDRVARTLDDLDLSSLDNYTRWSIAGNLHRRIFNGLWTIAARTVTGQAGAWFLPRPGSVSATRWHRFTGDLAFHPEGWMMAGTACGWEAHLRPDAPWSDDVPGDACQRCLAVP